VPAHVIKSAQFAIGSPHYQKWLANQLSCEIVSWLPNLGVVANDVPTPAKNRAFLGRVNLCIEVQIGRQRPGARHIRVDSQVFQGDGHLRESL
jgi:hypothetical protein